MSLIERAKRIAAAPMDAAQEIERLIEERDDLASRLRRIRDEDVPELRGQLAGAVDRVAELEADLERERLARHMVDQALRDALARADAGGQ
jgi:chromosome segregation ATPase